MDTLLLICPDLVRLGTLEKTALAERKLHDAPIEKFRGENLQKRDIEKIQNLLSSTSLFSPRQIIKISKIEEIKTDVLDLFIKANFDSPTDNLLLCTASALKSNSRIRKLFKKDGKLEELKPLKDGALLQWAAEQAKSYRLSISRRIAELLIHIAESSPDRIDQLLSHLAIYCDGEKPTEATVLGVFNNHPDPNEFLLLEQALKEKTTLSAQRTLRELLENGKNPFLILGLLGKTISKLLSIRVMLEAKKPAREIQSFLKSSDWMFKKQLTLAKQCSVKQLKRLIEQTAVADGRLKDRSLGAEWILTDLLRAARVG